LGIEADDFIRLGGRRWLEDEDEDDGAGDDDGANDADDDDDDDDADARDGDAGGEGDDGRTGDDDEDEDDEDDDEEDEDEWVGWKVLRLWSQRLLWLSGVARRRAVASMEALATATERDSRGLTPVTGSVPLARAFALR
jgi:hypothetical protein